MTDPVCCPKCNGRGRRGPVSSRSKLCSLCVGSGTLTRAKAAEWLLLHSDDTPPRSRKPPANDILADLIKYRDRPIRVFGGWRRQ